MAFSLMITKWLNNMAIREQNCNYRIKIHGINNLPLKNPQGKYLESKTESDNYIHHQSNIDS